MKKKKRTAEERKEIHSLMRSCLGKNIVVTQTDGSVYRNTCEEYFQREGHISAMLMFDDCKICVEEPFIESIEILD